jgi:hypothetical protein
VVQSPFHFVAGWAVLIVAFAVADDK